MLLEALFRLEAEAAVARRHATLARLACLPGPGGSPTSTSRPSPRSTKSSCWNWRRCGFWTMLRNDATNLLFIGPPGVGKTMLSIGLGWAVIDAGHKVHYTTASDLAARCHKAALEGRWANMMSFYSSPSLLIIDELGYLQLPEEAAAALFQVVAQRYLRASTCITTNLGIASWAKVTGDPVVASAMLDRLLHRSVVIKSTVPPTGCGPIGPCRGGPEGGGRKWPMRQLSRAPRGATIP